MDLIEAFGTSNSKKLYVHYPAGTYQATELKDDTHFNPFGAYEVAKCVVMGLKKLNNSLIEHLRNDWKDFDPKTPDKREDFVWVPAPSH